MVYEDISGTKTIAIIHK